MRNVYGWSMAALVCLTGFAFAQNEAQPLQPGAGAQPGASATQPARPGIGQPGQPGRQPGQPGFGQPGQPGQPGVAGRMQAGTSDQQIAALILAGCRNEIEIAKFAKDRLQSEQAKQFADKLLQEHAPGCERLAQLAGPLGQGLHVGHEADTPATLRPGATRPGLPGADRPGADRPGLDRPGADRPGADRPGADRPTPRPGAADDNPQSRVLAPGETVFVAQQEDTPRPKVRPGAAGQRDDDTPDAAPRVGVQPGQPGQPGFGRQPGQPGFGRQPGQMGQLDWNAIHKEIADRCLQATKEELERHDGHEFDRAFLGQQLIAHGDMAAKLEVLKNHASPQLQQLIENELRIVKSHQEEARRLMDQLASDPSIRTARPPARPGETIRPGLPGADRPGADRPGADLPGADRPGADRPGATTPPRSSETTPPRQP